MLALLNDPDFIRYVGDRGVRTEAEARRYLLKEPIGHYAEHGYGMYVVARKTDPAPMGLCGLVNRPGLDDVDVGFAFLPAYRRQGYAFEAAEAVMAYGRRVFGLTRIVGITQADNAGSIRTLEKLGLRFERRVRLPGEETLLQLYAPPP